MTAASEKLLFTCAGCGYKARIPSHYAGRSIHCPQCKSVQAVPAVEEPSGSVPAMGLEAAPAPTQVGGKIVFACTSCAYKGRLSAEYEGKTIRCPGCQTPQVVKGTPLPSPIVASLAADEPVFKGMEGDKVRFVCASCGYRARIPSKYAGKPIHCPQCKKVEVVKPEADMEESTGKTVSISKISSVEVKEPRLAMTNVGVQFACAVCGYESRISPSCVGDAIYCPKCRSPQKVEWSDPNAAKTEPADSALEAKAAPAQPEPLPTLSDEPIALPEPKSTIAPLLVAAPTKRDSPVAPPLGDITDIQAILSAPDEPKPAPAVMVSSKKGGRRVISAAPRGTTPAMAEPAAVEPPAEVAQAPAATPSVQPKRRSVATPAKLAEADEPDTEETAKAMPAARRTAPANAASGSAAPASKLPLFMVAGVAALLLIVAGALFMQMKSLNAKLSVLEQAQVKAQADAQQAKKDAEAATKAKADVEQQLTAATAAAEAVKLELEKLKALTPAPDAPKPPVADPVVAPPAEGNP